MILINVVKAIVVRCALIFHVLVTVWRVTEDLEDQMYWLLCVIMVPFCIEGLYTICKRGGVDFRIFTPCFFFYMMTTIPCVWLLELKKSDKFLDEENADESNTPTDNVTVTEVQTGPDFGVDINPSTWTVLIEELLLYLLIISRWILPRGKVSREQLSELLFAFIGIASDIMEMFSIFGLEDVRRNRTLSYFVLGCWSLSLLQFCMTVTVIHEPRRAKNFKTIDDNKYEEERPKIIRQILAIFCSMLMQDVPFVTLRLYTIITYNVINYSLVFFTSKNVLVILLLFYKIAVLLQKRYCPEFLGKDVVDEENQMYENHNKRIPDKWGNVYDVSYDYKDSKKLHKKKHPKYKHKAAKGHVNKGYGKRRPLDSKPQFTSGSPNIPSSLNHLNLEITPPRQRRGENAYQQPNNRYSSSAMGNSSPVIPRAFFTPSGSRESSQKSAFSNTGFYRGSSLQRMPVSSGYGWVSSRK